MTGKINDSKSDIFRDLSDLSLTEIEEIIKSLKEPKYRAKQIFDWLHKNNARSYEEMINVPKDLKSKLDIKYPFLEFQLEKKIIDPDETIKFLWKLIDKNKVESVLLKNYDAPIQENKDERLTACISTQVGCPVGCLFCATGQQGFSRNLSSNEIVRQVIEMQKQTKNKVNNVVVMGQGEPFLNFDNTLKAIRIINKDEGLNIAARKITVSTCGVIDGIEKFTDVPEQFRLAVSLHSAVQTTRNVLIPKMKNMPLELLREALARYVEISNRRITFEYILIKGVNDTEKELSSLVEFCEGLLCHVNLLKLNTGDSAVGMQKLTPASKTRLYEFKSSLEKAGVAATIRKPRGANSNAACGQLANK